MNPTGNNPFSPNGQFQPGYGPNQSQSFMDQLLGMSESLQKEQQRQQLMSNMMPVLMGQGFSAPFQQGGGGGGYGRNNRDSRPLQCYHRSKDGTRCNGPHLARDCPVAARERINQLNQQRHALTRAHAAPRC